MLQQQKEVYLKYGVFTENMLNWIIDYLNKFNDQQLRAELGDDEDKILELVNKFFHCG